MDKMENAIIDTINVSDEIGPHGLVIITDKDGRILVKNHNMVVENGKKAVFNNLLGTNTRKVYYLYFGNSMNETTYEYDTIDRIESDVANTYEYAYPADKMMVANGEETHPYLMFNLNGIICDASKTPYLSCLSLTTVPTTTVTQSGSEQSSETNEELFSRIKFDPIPMVDGNQLNLTYYIYF